MINKTSNKLLHIIYYFSNGALKNEYYQYLKGSLNKAGIINFKRIRRLINSIRIKGRRVFLEKKSHGIYPWSRQTLTIPIVY